MINWKSFTSSFFLYITFFILIRIYILTINNIYKCALYNNFPKQQKKITVSPQIEDCINYGKVVGLSKLKKGSVTAENVGDTIQMTLFNNQNPVDSLYHNIHSVYAPLLLKLVLMIKILNNKNVNLK